MDGRDNITFTHARSKLGELSFDPAIGNLRALAFRDSGRVLHPLATAPWVEEPGGDLPEDLAPLQRTLSGDFFCAPFGASDVEPAPPHGWSANSPWSVTESGAQTVRAVLDRPVLGARLRKTLCLSANAPLLLQEHWIEGGTGALTAAHHPMVRFAGTARYACSAKRAVLTPDVPLEPGRARLLPGGSGLNIASVPGADGEPVDLSMLPIGKAHEDFVTLVEAEGSELGWSAVIREIENDIVFVLKDPSVLPVTMLWHSNGGRDYPPWNGRHRNVLGIEDGCAAGAAGHRAALGPNRVAATGVRTALPLAPGRTHRIAHAIGAIARPEGWSRVTDIRLSGDHLILTGDAGQPRRLPFPDDFLHKEA